ncbi:MAG: DUF211 domain-containing protein [Promethearchaeota archaeon]
MSNSMIRRLVLDILKPYDPELNIVASMLIEQVKNSSIEGVNITVYEMDRLTQKVKMIIEGKSLDYEEINDVLISMNCIVHSMDQVVAGEKIVEDIDTPQD